ncbi:MAG: XdhC family protein [Planctomycetes bacterium]|nr:XdhC family protein [Planctomycetota bacterium]
MADTIDRLLDRAADLLDAGHEVAFCLLAKTRGSTPAEAGALLIVDDTAATHGTIGGGCVEAEIRRRVMEMMAEGQSGLLHFKLDHDYGWDDGLICGGSIDVAVGYAADAVSLRTVAAAYRRREATELRLTITDEGGARQDFVLDLPPRPRLLIAGAGHIGQALARLARDLDFEVVVFDDRQDLLEKFGDGVHRIAGHIHEKLAAEPIDGDTYVVIVTRGHRHDEQVLEAVIPRPARYVGMIGSRRKVKVIFDDLAARGVPADALERVHAPIGVEIGSVTVNEVALSIAAQLVEVRRAGYRGPVRGPLAVDAVGP